MSLNDAGVAFLINGNFDMALLLIRSGEDRNGRVWAQSADSFGVEASIYSID